MRELLELERKMKEVFPAGTLKELILIEFEGRMLPIPKNYDAF